MSSTTTTTTTRTNLSPTKVGLLLEGLINLRNKTLGDDDDIHIDLRGLDDVVDDFLEAQEMFIRGIDRFMHNDRELWDFLEEETITTIITICPEVLNTVDHYGRIPLELAAGDIEGYFVPLLAKVGYVYGVGGKDGRGGLLLVQKDGERNALQNSASDHLIMEELMGTDPPLFKKEDTILTYDLLHHALGRLCYDSNILECLKLLIDLDPSCLLKKDSRAGKYPIEHAVTETGDITVVQYLLKRTLEHNPRHPSIGGLFFSKLLLSPPDEDEDEDSEYHEKTTRSITILCEIMKKFGEEDAWNMIQQEILPYRDIPILHRMIEIEHRSHLDEKAKINQVISRFPHSLFLRDANNRLPIHVALEKGMQWSGELVAIMSANMSHLVEKDPVTGYYPFALAAEEPRCDLKTIHYLLRMHPGQIESGIDNDKDKDDTLEPTKSHESKRRRIE